MTPPDLEYMHRRMSMWSTTRAPTLAELDLLAKQERVAWIKATFAELRAHNEQVRQCRTQARAVKRRIMEKISLANLGQPPPSGEEYSAESCVVA
jgi:hypothetical protein